MPLYLNKEEEDMKLYKTDNLHFCPKCKSRKRSSGQFMRGFNGPCFSCGEIIKRPTTYVICPDCKAESTMENKECPWCAGPAFEYLGDDS